MGKEDISKLISKAEEALDQHDASSAAALACEALSRLSPAEEPLLAARVNKILADSEYASCNFFSAEQHYDAASDLFALIGATAQESHCQLGIAECNRQSSQLGKSRYITERILKEALDRSDRQLHAAATSCMGKILFHENQYSESARYLKEAVGNLKYLGDEKASFEALQALATCWAFLGKYNQSRKALGQVIEYLTETGESSRVTNALISLALVEISTENYQEARGHAERVLDIARERNDIHTASYGHYYLGEVALATGQLSEAKKCFHRTCHVAHKHCNSTLELPAWCQLAIIALLESKPEDALNYCNLANDLLVANAELDGSTYLAYLPLALLANNQFDEGREAWRHWPRREPLAPDFHTKWAVQALKHLLTPGFRETCHLDAAAVEMARQWLEKLQAALNQAGKNNPQK